MLKMSLFPCADFDAWCTQDLLRKTHIMRSKFFAELMKV